MQQLISRVFCALILSLLGQTAVFASGSDSFSRPTTNPLPLVRENLVRVQDTTVNPMDALVPFRVSTQPQQASHADELPSNIARFHFHSVEGVVHTLGPVSGLQVIQLLREHGEVRVGVTVKTDGDQAGGEGEEREILEASCHTGFDENVLSGWINQIEKARGLKRHADQEPEGAPAPKRLHTDTVPTDNGLSMLAAAAVALSSQTPLQSFLMLDGIFCSSSPHFFKVLETSTQKKDVLIQERDPYKIHNDASPDINEDQYFEAIEACPVHFLLDFRGYQRKETYEPRSVCLYINRYGKFTKRQGNNIVNTVFLQEVLEQLSPYVKHLHFVQILKNPSRDIRKTNQAKHALAVLPCLGKLRELVSLTFNQITDGAVARMFDTIPGLPKLTLICFNVESRDLNRATENIVNGALEGKLGTVCQLTIPVKGTRRHQLVDGLEEQGWVRELKQAIEYYSKPASKP